MNCNILQYVPNDDVYSGFVEASDVIGCELYIDNLVEIKPNKDDTETYQLIYEYEEMFEILPRVKIRFDSFLAGEVSLIYPDNKGNYFYKILKKEG